MFFLILFALIGSLIALRVFAGNLHRHLAEAKQISPVLADRDQPDLPSVSIVIPAYNEAENIRNCVNAVLNSSNSERLEVWVVDDQSSDQTLAIVQAIQDPRLKVLAGEPRPAGEGWVGKNWACAQVTPLATGEFLLFIDADVQIKRGAIETAVAVAQREQADLLTFWMTIVCGGWGEWLAQPIIASLFAAGYSFAEVCDPNSERVFAVGPFMLFRRSAYEQIGGHRSVAREVVEDVQLGRRIKQYGLTLWYGLGHDMADVRMYRSIGALWEGWTKNWYVGSNRNLKATLYTAFVTLLIFTVPWLGLTIALINLFRSFNGWDLSLLVLALIAIVLQYDLRRLTQKFSNIPPRYWWLSGLGGVLVSAIAIASIIKTETGWGWTWRGRNLSN
ncbi:MAG: glycosyltransferase family 2 protein [Phormidesmis sp. CAN_BIN36]|nr:glycosyltransferase family 2 protein [Phormidesmis sp. CAN_BIN36]